MIVACVQILPPLRLRAHEVSSGKMPYDERYTPYIQELGLLPFIQMVSRSTPNMNACAITAFVDHWSTETHTFHLRPAEMTPTLQDVSMILGLLIEGKPLCIDTTSKNWRVKMEKLIGKVPGDYITKNGRSLWATTGATFQWISDNFKTCPEGANEAEIMKYARVYVWYVITRTLFPDSSGKTAHWHWLSVLSNMRTKWSWGSAALAYLYRQVINCFYFVHIYMTYATCATNG